MRLSYENRVASGDIFYSKGQTNIEGLKTQLNNLRRTNNETKLHSEDTEILRNSLLRRIERLEVGNY